MAGSNGHPDARELVTLSDLDDTIEDEDVAVGLRSKDENVLS